MKKLKIQDWSPGIPYTVGEIVQTKHKGRVVTGVCIDPKAKRRKSSRISRV